MNLIDLIIIYLACGSPFGVYQITKQPSRSFLNWAGVVSSFIFWPAYAVTLLAGRFFANDERAENARHNRIENIRTEIERIAFSDESISSLFEFREVFYRFAGLSEALNTQRTGNGTNQLFEVTNHPDKSRASRCLARANRDRLARHRSKARDEFVDRIIRLTGTGPNGAELLALALELSGHLRDPDAAKDVAAFVLAQTEPVAARKSGLENQVWKSRTQPESTISSSPINRINL